MESIEMALGRGALSAAELRTRLDVSPTTLMRMVRKAGPEIVRIGRGRATQYGLRQQWPTLDTARFPLFRISDTGTAASAGTLTTLAARQSLWMPEGRISDGLPIELVDARPYGFLGRHFAAVHADLRLPLRLTDWSDHHILSAMSRRGEDLPGNLIVGEESFLRWQALNAATVTRGDYPALATATIAGHPPGASAGGEQPKFGVLVEGRHVLVKFAARGGAANIVGERRCDLLILECLALEVIASRGIPAARTTILETSSHCFLESERFDRVGARGRRGVLSLAALYDDPAASWASAAKALGETGRISDDDARRLCWLDAFGALIGNIDRHQWNVVFFTDEDTPQLAPAYDHASMLYAPTSDGQVLPRTLKLPHITPDTLDVWETAQDAAREFWARGREDARLSDDMRTICGMNLQLFTKN
jgi:hypothetical protein